MLLTVFKSSLVEFRHFSRKLARTMASSTETSSDCDKKPLIIFFDSETTGLDTSKDSIIEIGAVVGSRTVISAEKSEWTFSRLIRINSEIPPIVSSIHGIFDEDLLQEESFEEVYCHFCNWIKLNVKVFSEEVGLTHYPVLGVHNGYNFDFPLLFSELKRHEIGFNFFKENDVRFFDTYQHLFKLKNKEEYTLLASQKSLSLQRLYERYFPHTKYKGHRALVDAENLCQIILDTELKPSLSAMQAISFDEMERRWLIRQECY